MSKQFIKTANGKDPVGVPKIRVYPSTDDLTADMANIPDGEIVASQFLDTAGDISADIEALGTRLTNIEVKIPAEASSSNQLADKAYVDAAITGEAGDISALSTRVSTIEGVIPSGASTSDKVALSSTVTGIDTRVTGIEGKIPDAATSSNKMATASDISGLDTRVSANELAISGMLQSVYDAIFPIGAIYQTESSTFDPNVVFGHTWVQINDRVLVGQGTTYTTAGATGGSSSVTIGTTNLPAHKHSINSQSISISGSTTEWKGKGRVYAGYTETGSGENLAFGPDTGEAYDGYTNVVTPYARWQPGRGNTGGDPLLTSGDVAAFNIDVTHSHTISGTGTLSAGETGDGPGSGAALNVMNPYEVVYIWKRTA